MSVWRRLVVHLVTWLVMAFARRSTTLSDRALARLVRVVRVCVRGPHAFRTLSELEQILLEGPPGTVIVRKILSGLHREEVRDWVVGTLFADDLDPIVFPRVQGDHGQGRHESERGHHRWQ